MQSKVAKLLPSESDPSSVGAVVLGDGGPTLPADFVVMGVGVAPATGFLKDSGFALERDGGVRVDEYLRVSGLDGSVYAIGAFVLIPCSTARELIKIKLGDIAVFPQAETGEARRIEHWNVRSSSLLLFRCRQI